MARQWPRRPTRATSKDHGVANGYRSGLEEKVAADLTSRGIRFAFEQDVIAYEVPATKHKYTPDFLLDSGVYVETKGFFKPEDRKKHLHVRESRPDLDIRFLFQRASTPIRKGSKTTYGDWATKNGFKWCEKTIPQEWIDGDE
jgi:predicted nuclease of restriction endonuclease-like RecB superfamily